MLPQHEKQISRSPEERGRILERKLKGERGSDRHRSSRERERERDVHCKLFTQRVLGFNKRERERGGGGNFFYITRTLFLSLGEPKPTHNGYHGLKKP